MFNSRRAIANVWQCWKIDCERTGPPEIIFQHFFHTSQNVNAVLELETATTGNQKSYFSPLSQNSKNPKNKLNSLFSCYFSAKLIKIWFDFITMFNPNISYWSKNTKSITNYWIFLVKKLVFVHHKNYQFYTISVCQKYAKNHDFLFLFGFVKNFSQF